MKQIMNLLLLAFIILVNSKYKKQKLIPTLKIANNQNTIKEIDINGEISSVTNGEKEDSNNLDGKSLNKNIFFKDKYINKNKHLQRKKTRNYFFNQSYLLNDNSSFIKNQARKLSSDDSVIIGIEKEDNNITLEIGLEGTINIITGYNDTERNIFDINDIEEKTSFDTIFIDENNKEYNTKCRLWKAENEKIRLFCNLQRIFKYSTHNLTLPEISFIYKNINIYIIPHCSIIINQITYNIPFLYSDKQTINIEEGINLYEFQFKADYYDNDILFYYSGSNYNILDNCKKEYKSVSCNITKDKLEENLILSESNIFKLAVINQDLEFVSLDSVFDIIINYISTEKTDIYVYITDQLTDISESGCNLAYKTNVTTIPNFKTNIFTLKFYDLLHDKIINSDCYFKKNNGDNLLLLCKIIEEGYFYILETDEKIKINNVNYKYNFFILPIYIFDIIKISDFGAEVHSTYPNMLNYTIEESLIIEYIMPFPNFFKNIRLNPDSPDLDCIDSKEIKTCIVPLSHFQGKESGYYHTYHSNHLNELSICYDSSPFYVILPNDNTIVLRIKESNNRNDINVGINGTLYFITDYNDKEKNIFNIKDIEEKTIFDAELINSNNNKFNAECRLWKAENEKIRIFCSIEGNLTYSSQYITMNTVIMKYNNYTIVIKSEPIKVKQIWYNIPFLYSYKQTINIEEGIDLFEFKFKADSYYNDLLYLYAGYSYILLDNCSLNINQKENEIIFTILKNKLEENLIVFNNNISGFKLVAMGISYGTIEFNSVLDIFIKHPKIEKIKKYIKIHDLLNNYTQLGEPVAYTTKYNGKLPNLITNVFLMRFIEYNNNKEEVAYCTFKKREGIDLLLLCEITDEGIFSLKPITEKVVLQDEHYKYIFIIIPSENNNIVKVSDFGTDVQITYPNILNFTFEDSLNIEYVMDLPNYAFNIKLNPDSKNDLECNDISKMKTCIVPLSHFQAKESGYYQTYHYINNRGYSVFYASAPFKVILPPENMIVLRIKEKYNKNGIILENNGIIYFITDYNNKEKCIFNSEDIKEKTKFKIELKDEEENKYKAECYLWKQQNENIRIYCNLHEKLKYNEQNITFNITTVNYNNYNIVIYPKDYINIKFFDTEIPFLYNKEIFQN